VSRICIANPLSRQSEKIPTKERLKALVPKAFEIDVLCNTVKYNLSKVQFIHKLTWQKVHMLDTLCNAFRKH